MLIRLIPTPPEPAILFAVTFPDLDDSLPMSPSWTDQLRSLQHDSLELPQAMHTLDRAAGLIGIVAEITFDVPALTISCRMADGAVQEWPLMEKGCLNALEGVVCDVNESSAEMERETEMEREMEKEKEKKRFDTPSGKLTRHKKQRSLLMTLVA